MKQFPRFSDAVILQSITQPQTKLLLAALNAFERQLNTETLAEQNKSLLAHCEQSYDFKFTSHYQNNLHETQIQVQNLIDVLCAAYCDSRLSFITLANQELHEHYQEHFDSDVYNIPEGETLRVADYG
jgi:hypothetical protein